MSDSPRARLKALFVSRYQYLRRHLEYYTGSKDNAADALHDAWLRLENMGEASTTVSDAYLLRVATNAATDRYRREQWYLLGDEVDEIFEVEDELADPQRIVAARREVDALKVVVEGLSPRRREILLAARVDGEMNAAIAKRLGISLRLVERELSEAIKQCYAQMLEIDATALENSNRQVKGRRKF
ncbi:RNA polymerase sigma factor [Paraburkholderia sp. ZP32-5]|uniref:RNA polymerase sigma factor n=1 Tax=Paraburkholderia sp. ZP32-5 TaxID=2883245 RepID=UPI001F35D49E|nr:RNA polymerase sigma factor [Paraburkholderia sp. ZP32-5]